MEVTEELKLSVWKKAKIVPGYDDSMFRKDACDAWIVWDKYGVQDNIFGWQIDHICPSSLLEEHGFSEEEINCIDNLRPLQHGNNAAKGDDYPSYTAIVTSDGSRNVFKNNNLVVNKPTRELLKSKYGIE